MAPSSIVMRRNGLERITADIAFAFASIVICGLDVVLPSGKAVIVLLVIVIILAGRYGGTKRVVAWTAVSVVLTMGEYFVRHGMAVNQIYLERRGICLLSYFAAAYVTLRGQWLESATRERAAILEQAGAAVFTRSAEGRIISWSNGAELLYGWRSEDVIGRRSSDIFGDDPPDVLQSANSALITTGRWQGSIYRRNSAGQTLAVLCQWASQDIEGSEMLVLESNTDITEYKTKEAEIRKSEEHFRGIFEMAGAAIWEEDYSHVRTVLQTLKENGITDFGAYFRGDPHKAREILESVRIVALNKSAVTLLQDNNAETTQNRRATIILRGPYTSAVEFLTAAAEGSHFYSAEMIISTRTSETRHILLSATFEGWERPDAHVLLSAVDITETKQAEAELVLSKEKLSRVSRSATLGQLTALVSGEVERPIANIVAGSLQARLLLESDTAREGAVNDIVKLLIREARYSSGIISDIRRFLKRSQNAERAVSIRDLIGDVLALLERELATYGVQVQLAVEPALPEILGGTDWLENAIFYMILRFIQALAKAAERDRHLFASVFRRRDEIVFQIDSGKQSSPSNYFEETHTEPEDLAQDIGFSICRTNAAARGGRVVVSSEAGLLAHMAIAFPI